MKKYQLFFALVAILSFYNCGGNAGGGDSTDTVDCGLGDGISYAKDIVPILETNCYECHNNEDYAAQASGNKMEGYEAFHTLVKEGAVVGSIKHSQGYIGMPYRKAKMDSCTIETIVAWIDQGAKNN